MATRPGPGAKPAPPPPGSPVRRNGQLVFGRDRICPACRGRGSTWRWGRLFPQPCRRCYAAGFIRELAKESDVATNG